MLTIKIPGVRINLGLFKVTITGRRIEQKIEEQIDQLSDAEIAQMLNRKAGVPVSSGILAAQAFKGYLKEIIVAE
jgi:hypothetical protein